MFSLAQKANPDTKNWNTAEVTTMSYMFCGAFVANPDTSFWDTSKVTNIEAMFAVRGPAVAGLKPNTTGWMTSKVTSGRMEYIYLSVYPDIVVWILREGLQCLILRDSK